jgi:hypothetical protein
MAVDVPTWMTAIATIGLLAGAAIYVVKAFGGQAKELAILAEQNERDRAERHRAQAARVFTGVEDVRPCIEFGGAPLAAHADRLIAPVKRMLHHVLPELPGGSNNADLHNVSPPAGHRRATPPSCPARAASTVMWPNLRSTRSFLLADHCLDPAIFGYLPCGCERTAGTSATAIASEATAQAAPTAKARANS